MDAHLEKKYDVIVQGTGLVECLVAGAAARIGKSVLHLDPSFCYGGQWASHCLKSLQKWVVQQQSSTLVEPTNEDSVPCDEGEQAVHLGAGRAVYSNVTCSWRDSGDETALGGASESERMECDGAPRSSGEPAASTPVSWEALLQDSRRFNVDLAPKILYSRGEMVELLISSNVARYVEFKCITRLLCWSGDRLLSVPCSRAQVFNSKAVSLLQKRLLMKFLQFAAVYSEQPDRWQDVRESAFSEFLNGERITGELQQYVMEGMALCGPHATVEEGLRSLHLFLTSLGRYGASPFLATLYGSGELPQAFCRLCAVFGGTYILERGISSVIIGPSPSDVDQPSDPNSNTDLNSPTPASKATTDDAQEKGNDSEPRNSPSQSTGSVAIGSCEADSHKADTEAHNRSSEAAVVGVVSDGELFKCHHLVIEDRLMGSFSTSAADTSSVSRAAVIVDRDLLQAFTVGAESATTDGNAAGADTSSKKDGGVALVQMRGGAGQLVTVLQFAADTSTCAPHTWLLHLMCAGSNAEQDLFPVVQQLVEHYARCAPPVIHAQKLPDDSPSIAQVPSSSGLPCASEPVAGAPQEASGSCDNPAGGVSKAGVTSDACNAERSLEQLSPVVYSLFYNQVLHSGIESPYPNLHFCSGPDAALDYDVAIRQARSIFSKMYPGEEFMPRAPDPDEIIFDDPAPIEDDCCSDDSSPAPDTLDVETQSQEGKSAPQGPCEKEDCSGDQGSASAENRTDGDTRQSSSLISKIGSELDGS